MYGNLPHIVCMVLDLTKLLGELGAEGARTERLDVRLSPAHKALIERAAAATGQQTSAFVVSTLTLQAQQVLEGLSTTVLSENDQRAFLRALDDSEPSDNLKAATARYLARRG